jgi:hypothetical protein
MATRLIPFLCVVLTLLTGCSDYLRRWDQPKLTHGGKDPFEGSYQGVWESTQYKGATGKLWCILTRTDKDVYKADFRATWHGIFASQHTVFLRIKERSVVRGEPMLRLEGAMKISMWIGSGNYHSVATVRGRDMTAQYDAEYDRGTFTLRRAKP